MRSWLDEEPEDLLESYNDQDYKVKMRKKKIRETKEDTFYDKRYKKSHKKKFKKHTGKQKLDEDV